MLNMEKRLLFSKKRGMSAIVSTVLLVFVTIVAVVVIAGFIVPFVKNSLESGSECLDFSDSLQFDSSFGFTCVGSDGLYGVTVRNSLQEDFGIGGFVLVFMKDGGAKSVKVLVGDTAGDEVGEIRMLNKTEELKIPERGEVRTYVYHADKEYDSVEISPILENGKICEKTASSKFVDCSPGGKLG